MTTATIKRPGSVRLSARLNSALNEQARELNTSKDALVRLAIVNMLEEIEDIKTVKARHNEPTYTLAEVKAELGL